MLVKGTVIDGVICVCCLNEKGQKKVIDTFFEGRDLVIIFKCLACNGYTKINYKSYLRRPFNGAGFKVNGYKEINEEEIKEKGFHGLFDEE